MVGDSCKRSERRDRDFFVLVPTLRKDRDFHTFSNDTCGKDTKGQEYGARRGPPTNNVTNQVYLLLTLILHPETDAILDERPRAG